VIRVVLEHRARDNESARRLVEVIREIRAEAMKQPGFITGETLVNVDNPCQILVISTWQRPEEWKAWDQSEKRIEMKGEILELLAEPYTVTALSFPIIWNESIAHVF
jgi:heme-degrading monooxygenase HmoA